MNRLFNKVKLFFLLLAVGTAMTGARALPAAPIPPPPLYFPLHSDGRPWQVGDQQLYEDGSHVTHFYLVGEDEGNWTERLCVRSFRPGMKADEQMRALMESVQAEFPDSEVEDQMAESSARSALVNWSASEGVLGVHRVLVNSKTAIALTYANKNSRNSAGYALAKWRSILADTGLAPDYG